MPPAPTTPPPAPPLPVSIIEQVLAIAPNIHSQLVHGSHNGLFPLVTRFSSRTTPLTEQELVALLHVLPHRLVPQALQSVLVKCAATPCSHPETDLVHALLEWLAPQMPIDGRGDDSSLARFFTARILEPLFAARSSPELEYRVVEAALAAGNIDLLNWLQLAGLDFVGVSSVALAPVAANGHFAVLEWWHEHGFDMYLSEEIGDAVGSRGHLPVLEWFRAHTDDLDQQWGSFQHSVVISACRFGHVHILEWLWETMRPQLEFNWSIVWNSASRWGQVCILQWAFKVRIALPLHDSSDSPIDIAAEQGQVRVLDWWVMQWSGPHYTHQALDKASRNGHVDVLEWFGASGLELRFTPAAISGAAVGGHIACVKWWGKCAAYKYLACGKPAMIDGNRMIPRDLATLISFGRLDWLKQTGVLAQELVPGRVGFQAVEAAVVFGQVHILEAFRDQFGLIIARMRSSLWIKAAQNRQLTSLQWLYQFGRVSYVVMAGVWRSCAQIASRMGLIPMLLWILSVEEARRAIKDHLRINGINGFYGKQPASALTVLEAHGVFEDLSEKEVQDMVGQALQCRDSEVVDWWERHFADRFE